MKTVNSIIILAPPEVVFRTAANVHDWPRILPHYRWVRRVREGPDEEVIEMAARRSWMPVRWTAVYRPDAARRRLYFTHIGGLARGMEVVWSIEPASGGTFVSITHDLALKVPIVRTAPGKFITGRIFVEHIAGQTLRQMKHWIEERCGAQSSPV